MNPNALKAAAQGGLTRRPPLRLPEANRLLQHALKFQRKGIIKMNDDQLYDLASSVEQPNGEINETKLEQLRKVVMDAVEADNQTLQQADINNQSRFRDSVLDQNEAQKPRPGARGSTEGGSGCLIA